MGSEDGTIAYTIIAEDQASGYILTIANNFEEMERRSTKSMESASASLKQYQTEILAAGAASAAFLALSAKGFADEEQEITNAARAISALGGDYDDTRKQIAAFSNEMESQGYSASETTEAITLLTTKAGMSLSEAMSKSADFMAAAEARGLSLRRAMAALTSEEENEKLVLTGANDLREKSITVNERAERLIIRVSNATERLGELIMPAAEKFLSLGEGIMAFYEKLDPAEQDAILGVIACAAAIVSLSATAVGLALAWAKVVSIMGIAIPILADMAGSAVAVSAGILSVISGAAEIIAVIIAIATAIALLKSAWDENLGGIQDISSSVFSSIKAMMDAATGTIADAVSSAYGWGKELIENFINGIMELGSSAKNAVSEYTSVEGGAEYTNASGVAVTHAGGTSATKDLIASTSKLAEGGQINTDGLVYVHAGETVAPRGTGTQITIPLSVGGPYSLSQNDISRVLSQLNISLQQLKNSSSGGML